MEFLLILCGASLALGLFFIAADLFKLPRLATQKALLSAGLPGKKAGSHHGCTAHGLGCQTGPSYPHG